MEKKKKYIDEDGYEWFPLTKKNYLEMTKYFGLALLVGIIIVVLTLLIMRKV